MWPHLEIRITTREGAVDQGGLSRILDFVWEVLSSERAQSGVRLTYDLRRLKYPKMSLVIAIAQWGSEPSRQATFKNRIVACSVCVNDGFTFIAAKAAVGAFFKMCPPTCRTFLVTQLEAPGPLAPGPKVAVFEPPPGQDVEPPAAAQEPAGADAAPAAGEPLDDELRERVSAVVHHRHSALSSGAMAGSGFRKKSVSFAREPAGGCLSCFTGWLRRSDEVKLHRSQSAELTLVHAIEELQKTVEALAEKVAHLEKEKSSRA